MKKEMTIAALLCIIAASAFAEGEKKGEGAKGEGRDECLLDTTRCEQQGYPLMEKIERLKAAIAKGAEVYTPGEMELLKKKLQEAEEYYDLLAG